jgi:uncharacterized membrane protein YjgN (DUF898 family)
MGVNDNIVIQPGYAVSFMGYSMKRPFAGGPLAILLVLFAALGARIREFGGDRRGLIDMGRILGIVAVIAVVLVAILVVAAFIGPVFDATGSLSENFSEAETGDDTVDTMLPILGTIVVLAIVLGLVSLIVFVTRFRGR